MLKIKLYILDQNGNIKLAKSDFEQVVMTYKGEYHPGDQIVIEVDKTPCYLKVRLEDSFESALLYLTEPKMVFTVPFGDASRVYNSDKAFRGGLHLLWARAARAYEIANYADLAYNPYLQAGQTGVYPTVSSNIDASNIRFAARNVVDGYFDSSAHGSYPYTSWSNAQDPNAQLIIDFGRDVEIDTIVLYLRADFPHDSWWQSVSCTFVNETDKQTETFTLTRTGKAQHFSFAVKKCQQIILSDLIKADDPIPFTALSQIEVLGKNLG